MIKTYIRITVVFMLTVLSAGLSLAGDDDLAVPKRPHLVMDIDTGEVLSQEMAFARWAPASLTKMMTAYTIFRTLELGHLEMNSPVRISQEAIAQPPSKMGFPVGTILTIETALKIIMVKSANDVSVALAQATSGTEEQFVSLMNSHARRLGMTDSHFTNPHGLHEPEQYTSARDMAVLSLQLTKEFPQYARFFDIPAIRFDRRRLRNHNALLRQFDGTNGMKTGYVCASGFNVVVRTQRNDRRLLAIVMGGDSGFDRNIKAAMLLKYAFENKPSENTHFDALIDPNPKNLKVPFDITNRVCPFKYSALGSPGKRPLDAPKANEFDRIDTRLFIADDQDKVVSSDKPVLAKPEKRPAFTSQAVDLASKAHEQSFEVDLQNDEISEEASNQTSPPTRRELAQLYYSPASNLREDVRINLGGATGLNPHGIKHTDGGVYVAPIPVPIQRPAPDGT